VIKSRLFEEKGYKILVRNSEDLSVNKGIILRRILQLMGCEDIDLIHNMIQWWAPVNLGMNIWVS
jgi:hypothetical protein